MLYHIRRRHLTPNNNDCVQFQNILIFKQIWRSDILHFHLITWLTFWNKTSVEQFSTTTFCDDVSISIDVYTTARFYRHMSRRASPDQWLHIRFLSRTNAASVGGGEKPRRSIDAAPIDRAEEHTRTTHRRMEPIAPTAEYSIVNSLNLYIIVSL